jgi:hypothetical protein
VIQRDARYVADPEQFDPDRWTPGLEASLPQPVVTLRTRHGMRMTAVRRN